MTGVPSSSQSVTVEARPKVTMTKARTPRGWEGANGHAINMCDRRPRLDRIVQQFGPVGRRARIAICEIDIRETLRFGRSQGLGRSRPPEPASRRCLGWLLRLSVTPGSRHHLAERQGHLLPNSTGGHSSETFP